MNLWFRLLYLQLQLLLRRRPRIDVLDSVALDLRVWPTDLDVFRHVNNGRYLSLMDLGRLALMERTGLLAAARAHRWMPLVRGIDIEYYKPLRPWQPFTLHTRLLGWDRKWLYLEQQFERGDTRVAEARVHGLLRGGQGNVPPAEILAAIGQGERASPPVPAPPTA